MTAINTIEDESVTERFCMIDRMPNVGLLAGKLWENSKMMIDASPCPAGARHCISDKEHFPSSALPAVPSTVFMSCYRVKLRFPEGLVLPGFASFALHGMIGASLRELSPEAYAILFGEADIIHPWLISGFGNQLTAGATVSLELRLFNDAVRLLPELIGALMLAGCSGLGPDRAPFELASLEVRRAGTDRLQVLDFSCASVPEATPLVGWCVPVVSEKPIRVTLQTPTALKEANALVRSAPSFQLLITRTLARLSLLSKKCELSTDDKSRLLNAARAVEILESAVCWQEEQRYSGRQKRTMPFGGLVGELLYDSGAGPLAHWLEAAAWVGLGGKTTFGFGQLRWSHAA